MAFAPKEGRPLDTHRELSPTVGRIGRGMLEVRPDAQRLPESRSSNDTHTYNDCRVDHEVPNPLRIRIRELWCAPFLDLLSLNRSLLGQDVALSVGNAARRSLCARPRSWQRGTGTRHHGDARGSATPGLPGGGGRPAPGPSQHLPHLPHLPPRRRAKLKKKMQGDSHLI